MVCVNLAHCILGNCVRQHGPPRISNRMRGSAETVRIAAVWADTTRPYPRGQEGVQAQFPSRPRTREVLHSWTQTRFRGLILKVAIRIPPVWVRGFTGSKKQSEDRGQPSSVIRSALQDLDPPVPLQPLFLPSNIENRLRKLHTTPHCIGPSQVSHG